MRSKLYYILLLLAAAMTSCRNVEYIEWDNYDNDNDPYDESQVDLASFPDWDYTTHGHEVDPDYNTVFAQGEVIRLDITISTSSWSTMLSDVSSNYSKIDSSGSDYTPIWQPCTITHNETDWYKVGVRFKGNSSLKQTYSSGNRKLSLKLDFDQYEDDYPALTNQRFYGFKQLNLNNNYNDESLMREKVGSDLFREFGLASAQTSFCALYINDTYYGLYTIVEEVDDTLLDSQFSDSPAGNLYKPDGDAASFKEKTYDTDEFYLKTNTTSPDYSDVKALYDALHGSNRTSNSTAWRETLESVFDVDVFLKWLAANAVIQNWDTYGVMTHNYYLYNYKGKLTWIPWDNNEAFQSGTGNQTAIDLSKMGSVTSSWPLISYLYDVSDYVDAYKANLQSFIDDVFVQSEMETLYESYYDLLLEYASAETSGKTFFDGSPATEFRTAVNTLKYTHLPSRISAVNSFL